MLQKLDKNTKEWYNNKTKYLPGAVCSMVTKYIKWENNKGFCPEELKAAKELILTGGLVAFPTETVYGLGGNALSEEAAKKIYAAKGRPSDNPLIAHIADIEALNLLVDEVPEKGKRLINVFWPGPLTMIFKKKASVPYGTTGGLDTVAVRMPDHPAAAAFLRAVSVPVAAPSANTSGRPSPTLARHVKEDLGGKIDMIIDGGQVGIGIESTIVDLTEDIPVILRPGYITKEMLEKEVGEVRIDKGLIAENVKPKAPGMKYRHYAPKGELTIFEGEQEAVIRHINHLAEEYSEEKVGILATEETKDRYKKGHVICVGSREKGTISKELYRALREFDTWGATFIFAESFSGEPHGEAIMNRLAKAAGQRIVYL